LGVDDDKNKYMEIVKMIEMLSKSKKKNELVSADINKILLSYVQKYGADGKELTVIHHHYIE